jgi:hypothetical protein
MELARGHAGAGRERVADAVVLADALGMRAVAARARDLVAGARVAAG